MIEESLAIIIFTPKMEPDTVIGRVMINRLESIKYFDFVASFLP